MKKTLNSNTLANRQWISTIGRRVEFLMHRFIRLLSIVASIGILSSAGDAAPGGSGPKSTWETEPLEKFVLLKSRDSVAKLRKMTFEDFISNSRNRERIESLLKSRDLPGKDFRSLAKTEWASRRQLIDKFFAQERDDDVIHRAVISVTLDKDRTLTVTGFLIVTPDGKIKARLVERETVYSY